MKSLRTLLLEVADNPDETDGICDNLRAAFLRQPQDADSWKEMEEHLSRLQALILIWPKYSGSPVYPVPSGNAEMDKELGVKRAAERMFNICEFMWTGDYGAQRNELLDWLLAQLETEDAVSG